MTKSQVPPPAESGHHPAAGALLASLLLTAAPIFGNPIRVLSNDSRDWELGPGARVVVLNCAVPEWTEHVPLDGTTPVLAIGSCADSVTVEGGNYGTITVQIRGAEGSWIDLIIDRPDPPASELPASASASAPDRPEYIPADSRTMVWIEAWCGITRQGGALCIAEAVPMTCEPVKL